MPEREPEQIDFEDELKRRYKAQPFHAFEIVTSSGERYDVEDPSRLAFGHTAVVLVLPKAGIQVIRKSQITAIHLHETV
jgi:hypothetical protein